MDDKAPPVGNTVRCVELFAGGGGAALGLRAAGFTSAACVEGDAAAVATLCAAGFPGVRAWIGTPPEDCDIPGWNPASVRQDAGLHDDGEIHLVWASPPCQPWSRAGKQKGHSDSREGWPATIVALQHLRPRWVVIENVVGAPTQEWTQQLMDAGVCARTAVWDLDAVRYGLPSRRRRLFIIGRRDAGPMPRVPLFTHYAPEDEKIIDGCDEATRTAIFRQMRKWVSMGEALPDLAAAGLRFACRSTHPEEGGGEPTPCPERREIDLTTLPARCLAASYSGGKGGEAYVVAPATVTPGNGGNLPAPRTLDQPAHTVTVGSGQALYYTPAETDGKAGGKPEMLDLPAPCVVCSEVKGTRARRATGWTYNGGPDRASDAAFSATGRRRLEPEEVAVLVGFPTSHPFQGNKGQTYRQIGNAVAPVMGQKIAEAILSADRRIQ